MAALRRDRILWFIYYWSPVLILAAFIYSASSVPGRDIPSLFPLQDILYHFAIYVILALFFIRALKNTGSRKTVFRLAAYTVAFGFLFGAGDELHQLFTPGRSCAFLDLLTDTAGSFFGAAAGGVYLQWRL